MIKIFHESKNTMKFCKIMRVSVIHSWHKMDHGHFVTFVNSKQVSILLWIQIYNTINYSYFRGSKKPIWSTYHNTYTSLTEIRALFFISVGRLWTIFRLIILKQRFEYKTYLFCILLFNSSKFQRPIFVIKFFFYQV